MAKLKAEYLHQKYKTRPSPARLAPDGPYPPAQPARLGNRPAGQRDARKPGLQLAPREARRDRPPADLADFAFDNLRRWFERHRPDPRAGTRGMVVLLDDCFTTYNNPASAGRRSRCWKRADYRVELAGLACCGRPAISKGLLPLGRSLARENVAKLVDHARNGTPILGVRAELPADLVDEYRDFRLGPDADLVASAAKLVEAFVADRRTMPDLPLKAARRGRYCFTAIASKRRWSARRERSPRSRRVEGLEVKELDSGCCGMAGSFGYELGHYELSVALAKRVLLPAARAEPEATLLATGFSCRSQVHALARIHTQAPD